MMKNLLLISIFLLGANAAFAQSDTLLFENFDVDPTTNYLPFNSGNDTQWVNFDADGLPDANSRPQEWFWSDGAFASVDSVDACLFSSSWLAGFLPGNRNWLMTPPIQIVDANAVLSWASAPRQTPLYVDGYSVLVSTTDNIEGSFTDTLFQAAQYLTGAGSDYAAYTFSPGFVHGLDGTFTEFDAAADSSRLIGVLRPFTASLAQYIGQTIYITFLHDADDDNLMAIDDILVTGTTVGLNEVSNDLGLMVFPNPAVDKIELSYNLAVTSPVVADVYDVKGSKVLSVSRGIQIAGAQKLTLDIQQLAVGTYTVVLKTAGAAITSKFVKE
ncbi:MAG: choice-of-anchor J domain-containing protein [Bacteroidetes bacterium]|nr:choice-of-anchor J domain-containing protein [Bacteroidota bacterium]